DARARTTNGGRQTGAREEGARRGEKPRGPMNKPRLPTSLSKAWPGGFALRAPQTAYRISAAKGSVLAGDTHLWMMPPGASSFLKGSTPEGMGDALAVAVEPR